MRDYIITNPKDIVKQLIHRQCCFELDRQIYRYIDRQIDRQIERYIDRKIERQKDRYVDRKIDFLIFRPRV